MSEPIQRNTRHYFVDEAGDPVMFGSGGRIIVGTPGCSKTFMLGFAWLQDPATAERQLEALRASLLADEYLKATPSMQPEAKKTALCFHAKDDCPEVRREVFKLIRTFEAQVFVVVRRKAGLAKIGERARQIGATAKFLEADNLYDDLVKRLMRNHLHQADEYRILFARRGKRARIQALRNSLTKARANFQKKYGPRDEKPTDVESAYPSESAGLQIVDYYLWAIQRLYEKSESRFFDFLRPDYRLIIDLDDTTNNGYGEYYNSSRTLTPGTIKALDG